MNEGYIKFAVHLTKGALPDNAALSHLNEVRTGLHDSGLIGVLPNGIGYGNNCQCILLIGKPYYSFGLPIPNPCFIQ